jgi:AcrR family transcriptional regulator
MDNLGHGRRRAAVDHAGTQAAPPLDRRRRRHLQTREEILDAALEVMSEEGVAALNLTEVARRVGLRQPSLYQYFDSKTAVYEALFSRGMRQHTVVLRDAASAAGGGLAALRAATIATVRFSVENPVLSQLLFTRAVPGFTPSAEAYRPSLEAHELLHTELATAVERNDLHPEAASERGRGLLIALAVGISSLQEANDPGATFDEGTFTPLIEPALEMYARYFAPDR